MTSHAGAPLVLQEQPPSPPPAAALVSPLEPAALDPPDVTGSSGPLVVVPLVVVADPVLVLASIGAPPLLLPSPPLLLDSPRGVHPESSGGCIARHSS